MNASPAAPMSRKIPWSRTLVVIVLVGIAGALCGFDPGIKAASESGVVMQLPISLGNYLGYPADVSLAEKTVLPPDTEFARRTYESTDGDSIFCSIVLSGAERRSIHRPQECLPAQGWRDDVEDTLPIVLANGHTLQVRQLTLSREVPNGPGQTLTVRSYYLYWFVGKNISTPYHTERILLTGWDRIFHGINHRWGYVIISSLITEGLKPGGKSPQQTLEMLKAFTRDIVPYFQKSEMSPESKTTGH